MWPGLQLNIELFFRLLYDCLRGACYGSTGFSGLAHLWLWIVIIGYVVSVIALIVIVYSIMRIFELRKREEQHYRTLLVTPDKEEGTHPRWAHIQSLAEGSSQSEWREAIIEADIMLDDVLTREGYEGDGVGEKLKAADPAQFRTLRNAWDAHKVRNQIAHEGSAFDLSETVARRALAHYEAVFREFKTI